MGWLEAVRGEIIGIDTAPLIYFIEESPRYQPVVNPFFESLSQGHFRAVTSTITLLEVLVHPLRQGHIDVAQKYRDILLYAEGLTTLSVNPEIAEYAAHIRADYNLLPPDSIQLATALQSGAKYFLTNDARLPQLPNLPYLLLDELIQQIP